MTEQRPLRRVTAQQVVAGRGGVLGGDNARRVFSWDLTLECGHHVERLVKYRPLTADERPILGGQRNRPVTDRLPAPERARCDTCATLPPRTLDWVDAVTYVGLGITAAEVVRLRWPSVTDDQAAWVLWERTPYPIVTGVHDLADALAVLDDDVFGDAVPMHIADRRSGGVA